MPNPEDSTIDRHPTGRTWAVTLATGLAAGVIAWAIGEALFIPESGFVRMRGSTEPRAAQVGLRNGVAGFGALGAAMGLGLGLAGGLIRRSAARSTAGATLGLLLGGAAGAGLARLLIPIYYDNLSNTDLTDSLLVQGGIAAGAGAAAGWAFGLGRGGWARMLRAATAGAMAALLGTVVYVFAGSLLLPGAMTEHPVSATGGSRLLARLLVSMAVAAGMVLVIVPDAGRQGNRDGAGPTENP